MRISAAGILCRNELSELSHFQARKMMLFSTILIKYPKSNFFKSLHVKHEKIIFDVKPLLHTFLQKYLY